MKQIRLEQQLWAASANESNHTEGLERALSRICNSCYRGEECIAECLSVEDGGYGTKD